MTLQLPEALRSLTPAELEALCLKASVALWSEKKRGYSNAPFHLEWYQLMRTERRLCVIAPREHAKSETITVNGTAHAAIYQPGIWTYAFAASGDLAAELKQRIDLAVAEAEPWMIHRAKVRTKTETVYANGSRVTTAGTLKVVRGAHPDRICGDDVLSDATTATEYRRKQMHRWWHGTVAPMAHPGTTRHIVGLGRVAFPPTQIFLVGTPFHSQDLLMAAKSNPLYTWRRYSAEFDPERLVPGSYAVEAS